MSTPPEASRKRYPPKKLDAGTLADLRARVGFHDRPLSERRFEVLCGIAAGLTDHRIGRNLHIAATTVKVHVRLLLKDLDARNRAHAVAIGYDRGILPASEASR